MSKEHLDNFATTVQKHVTNATIIQPHMKIEDAVVEYCVSSGYVLIKDTGKGSAFVTHISNVVLELTLND
jgi:hypothetical protein